MVNCVLKEVLQIWRISLAIRQAALMTYHELSQLISIIYITFSLRIQPFVTFHVIKCLNIMPDSVIIPITSSTTLLVICSTWLVLTNCWFVIKLVHRWLVLFLHSYVGPFPANWRQQCTLILFSFLCFNIVLGLCITSSIVVLRIVWSWKIYVKSNRLSKWLWW